jgi:hypothetical protein
LVSGEPAPAVALSKRRGRSGRSASWSIIDREAFADFIEPALKRIQPGVKAAVVKIEKIADGEESEDPVMVFDVKQDLIDRMTDRGDNTQHSIHRIPPAGENDPLNSSN